MSSGALAPEDGDADRTLQKDAQWIQNASKLPRARFLMEHLSAFEAIISFGGVKGIEPPIEQTATWRRAFCHEYSKTDRPFNIVSADGKGLPKCIGILNLSGRHCMYYSESTTLAKVVCLSSQQANPIIVDGITAVIKKAEELNATILFTFCLPFQAGMERAYWEIRTIRKTQKGAIKDGELSFATGDGQPRTVPCTRSIEHWTDALVSEVSKKLGCLATAVCLDKEADEDDRKMTYEGLEGVVEMLKADRRKMMESHRNELALVHEKHKTESEKMLARVENAEQDASIRISKVAVASKTVEESMKKKEEQLNTHNITLREQVVNLQKSKDKAVTDLQAANLQHEEECNKAAARQKTLEAQVASISSKLTKTTADWAKQRKDNKNENDAALKKSAAKISELNSSLSAKDAALKAVEAGAKEARDMSDALKAQVLVVNSETAKLKASIRCYKLVLKIAATRLNEAVERNTTTSLNFESERQKREYLYKMEKKTDQKRIKELESQITEAMTTKDAEIMSLKSSLQKAKEALKVAESANKKSEEHTASHPKDDKLKEVQSKLKESQQEIGRNKHLLAETDKRVKYLEKTLKESDEEVRRLKKAVDASSPSREEQKTDKNGKKSKENEVSVNVNQNTAVYMNHPAHPHQQAFPSAHFTVDPQLENTISTLHSALSCITSLARSSSTNGKNAEVAQAKLDALTAFGVGGPQTQVYFDPHAQYHHHGHQRGF